MSIEVVNIKINIEVYKPEKHREAVAGLFLKADEANGDTPLRPQVRERGIEGAYETIDGDWLLAAIATADGEVVGFCGLAPLVGMRVEISEFLIDPKYRRHGVGQHLLGGVLGNVEQRRVSAWTTVPENHKPYIRFLEAHGFIIYNHYFNTSGEKHLLMERVGSHVRSYPIELKDYNDSLLDQVAALYVEVDEAYGNIPWSRKVREGGLAAAKEILSAEWHAAQVVYLGNDIIGFASLSAPVDGRVQLSRLMVHPDYRNLKVATKMINKLVDAAEGEGLQVWLVSQDNSSSIGLYEFSHFYELEKTRTRGGRPGVLMERPKP